MLLLANLAARPLLDCASEIASQHGCDRLEWAVRNEDAAKSASSRFGFRRMPKSKRKSKRRQQSERSVILLERRC